MQTKLFTNRTNLFLLPIMAGIVLLLGIIVSNVAAAPLPVAEEHAAVVLSNDLSDAEQADLLFMREEEKLARDVYLTFYDQWSLNLFQNIANSEQTHMAAILSLLDSYGLVDPVGNNPPGVFANPDLQILYDELVATGSQSLVDALLVGAAIEEIDIIDLDDAIARTPHADIVLVYQNLRAGSENHLRAFVNVLERQTGQIYQPQYLDSATYDAIINGASSQGNGQGKGSRGGGSSSGRGGNGRNQAPSA